MYVLHVALLFVSQFTLNRPRRRLVSMLPDETAIPQPRPRDLEVPPLSIRDRHGAKPYLKVFAIPLHPNQIIACMDKYAKEDMLQPDFAKLALFHWKVRRMLPSEWDARLANTVVALGGPNYWEALAVVIATNANEADREKAKNRELIETIKNRLGVTTDPGWYIAVQDE